MRIHRRVARHRHRLQRSFSRLWVGFTFSSTGDGLILGAVPLLAVVINPHPLAVSAVVAADNLPWLLLALPAGAFADRFNQGMLMALSNTFRAGVILIAALLILSDRMNLLFLILVVLLNAGARAVYYSSFQAMVPALVDSDSLERANGLLTGTESGTEHLAGPVVGTWLFAVGKAIPFLADSVSLVLSAFPFFRLHAREGEKPQLEESPSVWEGAKLLVRRPPPESPSGDGELSRWAPRYGGRRTRASRNHGVGSSIRRIRALPRRWCRWEPRGESVHQRHRQALRHRPNSHRRRNCDLEPDI